VPDRTATRGETRSLTETPFTGLPGTAQGGRKVHELCKQGIGRPESSKALLLAGLAKVQEIKEYGYGRNDAAHDRG
jgi:hypothetical protein